MKTIVSLCVICAITSTIAAVVTIRRTAGPMNSSVETNCSCSAESYTKQLDELRAQMRDVALGAATREEFIKARMDADTRLATKVGIDQFEAMRKRQTSNAESIAALEGTVSAKADKPEVVQVKQQLIDFRKETLLHVIASGSVLVDDSNHASYVRGTKRPGLEDTEITAYPGGSLDLEIPFSDNLVARLKRINRPGAYSVFFAPSKETPGIVPQIMEQSDSGFKVFFRRVEGGAPLKNGTFRFAFFVVLMAE